MNTQSLLSSLRERDVKLWVEGDRLRLNAPKGGLTPELEGGFNENKKDKNALLRCAGTTRSTKLPTVEPAPRAGALPLSFGQESLWFLEQLTPGTASYNIAFSRQLRQALDAGALERCLTEIVRRHER